MQRLSLSLAAGALALALAIGSDAARAADIRFVHGINGTDVGRDEALRVDIAAAPLGVRPVCLTAPGGPLGTPLAFGSVSKPIGGLGAGVRQIVLTVAEPRNPCRGDPAVTGLVPISAFDTVLVVAHLDANGAPLVSGFTVNASGLEAGQGRISAIHAAAAGPVDVEVDDTTFATLQNRQQTFPLTLANGGHQVRVFDAATGDLLSQRFITVDPGEVGIGITVGSAANESLTVLRAIIDPAD